MKYPAIKLTKRGENVFYSIKRQRVVPFVWSLNIIPKINRIKSKKLYLNAVPQLISGEYFSHRWCIENLQTTSPPSSSSCRFAAASSLWCCAPHPPTDDIIRCGLRWGAFKTANRRRTSQPLLSGEEKGVCAMFFYPYISPPRATWMFRLWASSPARTRQFTADLGGILSAFIRRAWTFDAGAHRFDSHGQMQFWTNPTLLLLHGLSSRLFLSVWSSYGC